MLFSNNVTDVSEALSMKQKNTLSIFNTNTMEMLIVPKWYIVYTRPRMEKKVISRFTQKNIEHYCPMKFVKTSFSSRQKTVLMPLFASCVFVNITPDKHSRLKKMWEVVNLVHWMDKPVVIENSEMDMLKRFLNLYTDITIEKIPVSKNNIMSLKYSSVPAEQSTAQKLMNGFVKLQWPSLGYEIKGRMNHEFKTVLNAVQEEKQQPVLLTKFSN